MFIAAKIGINMPSRTEACLKQRTAMSARADICAP
jgi:hypothetical protein